jgi:hypothetical protein
MYTYKPRIQKGEAGDSWVGGYIVRPCLHIIIRSYYFVYIIYSIIYFTYILFIINILSDRIAFWICFPINSLQY